jgi:predicted dienelactone hydrolase
MMGGMEASAGAAGAPSGHQRSLPLVVLSPGFTSSRSTLTALAEDLTSHGYVVAGIDHTYESHATAFPDGRVATCLAREARQRGSASPEKVAAGRAADVSFVLGELTGAHPPRSRAAACPGRSFSWAASPATPREAGSSRRRTGNT